MLSITDPDYARRMDREDPLAGFREELQEGDTDVVYLDGNSLGRLPKRTKARLGKLVEEEWGERLIRGWGEGWMDLPARLGAKLARFIGAGEGEVLVCDSTSVAHEKGAMVLWDISHSVGSVPLGLNACRADMAVGCTYKYLNGGPGSPAFLYVRKDLQDLLRRPIQGWFGSYAPFNFNPSCEPAAGIRRFQAGTPPVISMAAVEDGLDLHLEAGMAALREKSIRMTEYLIALFDAWLDPLGFRLGVAPIYNTYREVFTGMNGIREAAEKIMQGL